MAMPDDELRTLTDSAVKDLMDAATLSPNTPWHEACFAATFVLCQECGRRGISRQPKGVLH